VKKGVDIDRKSRRFGIMNTTPNLKFNLSDDEDVDYAVRLIRKLNEFGVPFEAYKDGKWIILTIREGY